MKTIRGLLCLIGCALVCASSVAPATEGELRTYAVLSLVSDRMSIVGYQPAIAGHQDQSVHDSIALTDRVLDNAAVMAAANAIKRLDASAATVLLASGDPKLYELQDRLFEQQDQALALRESVKSMIQSQHATHLVLISKHRGEAQFRLTNVYMGTGKIEGVGIYVDPSIRTSRSDTGQQGMGFLAPFAYIKVMLVDAKTMAIIREQTAEESAVWSAAHAPGSLNPWDVLTAAQKIAVLRDLLGKAIARVMPEVIGAR
jgi:hypothetical protein